jgi:exonuclease 3'-5' domain-containing protein 1
MSASQPPNLQECKTEIINTTAQIADLVDWLVLRHAPPRPHKPTMYLDLEGVNLCREGSLSILTLLIDTGIPTKRVCLIDVHTLGEPAFTTAGAKGTTLQDILQDATIPKVFFDVRNDSDALFAHFGVALQGAEDVQLMESAARKTTTSREFLNGLASCVRDYLGFGGGRLAGWKLAKEKGERLFKREHGGSYEVFNRRPMPEDIIAYCVGDVQYLPELRAKFWAYRWRDLVEGECKKRVAASQRSDYRPHGEGRAIAPWSEEQNMALDQWHNPPCDLGWSCESDEDEDDGDDWYDDGPTSCRDIIDTCDWGFYYSD